MVRARGDQGKGEGRASMLRMMRNEGVKYVKATKPVCQGYQAGVSRVSNSVRIFRDVLALRPPTPCGPPHPAASEVTVKALPSPDAPKNKYLTLAPPSVNLTICRARSPLSQIIALRTTSPRITGEGWHEGRHEGRCDM